MALPPHLDNFTVEVLGTLSKPMQEMENNRRKYKEPKWASTARIT